MALWQQSPKCLTESVDTKRPNKQVIILWGLVALAPGELLIKE